MDRVRGKRAESRVEDNLIADPGTGAAIPVLRSGQVPLVIGSAGAETNTLAAPTYRGQEMTIYVDTVGTGTRAVTASARINVSNNTVMTFDTAGDAIVLKAIKIGSNLRWVVASNDGVALS